MSDKIRAIKRRLASVESQLAQRPADEAFSLLACEDALQGVESGNYGVGALLVDGRGQIMFRAHNQVFTPHFRSDLHAEMVVVNWLEDNHHRVSHVSTYSLYSSIEPCPMCLGRLIISRIGTVKYVTADPDGGGMVGAGHLAKSFLNLMRMQTFAPASCSEDLQAVAFEIFMLNLPDLRTRLFERSRS